MMSLWIMAGIFTGLFAYPTYREIIKTVGARRGWGVILSFGIFALLFEYVAIKTGWPYGNFSYGEVMGPMLSGVVPLPVAWAWAPMVIGVATLGARISIRWAGVIALGLLIVVDLVVDPGAVAVKMWSYIPAGAYYGVPFVNFAG